MINGISDKPIRLLGAQTGQAAPVAKADDAVAKGVSGPASPAAAMASKGAPVDMDKIAAIRTAIAEGRYPVDPEKIAQRMIDLDLKPLA